METEQKKKLAKKRLDAERLVDVVFLTKEEMYIKGYVRALEDAEKEGGKHERNEGDHPGVSGRDN